MEELSFKRLKTKFISKRLITQQCNRLILSIKPKVSRFICSQIVFRHPDFRVIGTLHEKEILLSGSLAPDKGLTTYMTRKVHLIIKGLIRLEKRV